MVETAAVQEMQARLQIDENARPPSSRDITTLRIKSDEDDQTFILKMKFSETIGQLRSYLNKQRYVWCQSIDLWDIAATEPVGDHLFFLSIGGYLTQILRKLKYVQLFDHFAVAVFIWQQVIVTKQRKEVELHCFEKQ